MATVTFSMTKLVAPSGGNLQKNGRIVVTYTAGNGSITVHSIAGYRTDAYRTYGNSSSNQITLTIGSDSRTVSCAMIDFGTNSNANAWTDFTDQTWSGLNGNVTLSVTASKCNNTAHIQGNVWSGTINAGNAQRTVVVRIANMDQYGNYGTPWVWINTTVNYGASVDYWGYGDSSGPDNACYNTVNYKNSSVTTNIDTTVYASRQTYYFDVNGRLDGTDSGSTSGYGTFDVTINGTKKSTAASDYWAAHYYGSTYSVTNITPTVGHKYVGVAAGAVSGTMEGATSVRLSFKTFWTYLKVSGAWKQGDTYIKTGGAWKKATDVYIKVNGAWKQLK